MKIKTPRTILGMVISTVLALVVLAAVLRFLPPATKNAQAQAGPGPMDALTEDLQLANLQMSRAPLGQTLFIDGVAANTGVANVSGATVEVDFHDAQGKVVSRVEQPIGGIAHGTGFIKNEFSYNPIRPNEMRFFRVAIEQAPSGWNLEVPQLKVITVKEQ
jgi:hypothetical protein